MNHTNRPPLLLLVCAWGRFWIPAQQLRAALKLNILILTFWVVSIASIATAQQVTLESLLSEMVDRATIARFPAPAYTCKQFSSYDRQSTVPNPEDGKIEGRWCGGWFANRDFSNFLREETNEGRKEYVLLDTEGPGAVVRFWNTRGGHAWNYEGIFRIYLDDAPEPVIEMDAKELIGGDGLVGSPFSYLASDEKTEERKRGRNFFLPIPYAKRCKITLDFFSPHGLGWALWYYAINYRTYEAGTKVETFTLDQLEKARPLLTETAKTLSTPSWSATQNNTEEVPAIELPPGEVFEKSLTGPLAIRRLSLSLEADDRWQALRSVVLECQRAR